MTNAQKIGFAFFVFVSLVLAFWGYRALRENKQPPTKVSEQIPDGCAALIVFDDYREFSNSLRNKNLLWQDLQHLSKLKIFEEHFRLFDSLIGGNVFFSDLLEDNTAYAGVYPGKEYLIALNLKSLSQESEGRIFLESSASLLQKLRLKSFLQDGMIVFTNSENLAKKLFDRKAKKLISNKSFSSLGSSASYSGAKFYIGSADDPFFQNTWSFSSLKPDKIVLNGIKLSDKGSWFGDAEAESQSDYTFLGNIPLLCNSFEAFVCAREIPELIEESDWWKSVNERAMFNAKKQFVENLNDLQVKMLMPSGKEALLVYTKDSVKVNALMTFMRDTVTGVSQNIVPLKGSGFAESTFPEMRVSDLRFAILFQDRLVFTAEQNDALVFLNASKNKSSVLDNGGFRQFASRNLDLNFHYLKYTLVNGLPAGAKFPAGTDSADRIFLKNTGHCSYLAEHKDGKMNFRFSIHYAQDQLSEEPGMLWTVKEDTSVVTPLYRFKNHITDGNELVCQNSRKELCLYNATGKLIWKKKLNEHIKSEVYTVDAFHNKKWQMLFNSENYIHLIDRNGNYVQGYPLKLPAKASNTLTVHDYQSNGDYRLFIACADKKIYNYTIWGERHPGFKPLVTEAVVTLPVKYCRVGASDYLVTADRKGKIYAFSRKGEGRIDFKNKVIEDAVDFEVQPSNQLSGTYIVYYDKKGGLLDKISMTDIKDVYHSGANENSSCAFTDFDNNKITDALIAAENSILVFDLNGTKIFGYDLADSVQPYSVSFQRVPGKNFISIFDKENGKVLVYETEERIMRSFASSQKPSLCDLYHDGKAYLLIVNGGEMKCLKL